jgi:hypothetical protein
MARFYEYLVSSFPMLNFGMKPPFSFQEFLARCKIFIPENDYLVLEKLPGAEDYGKLCCGQALIEEWVSFDRALRNEVAKIRAERGHLDAQAHTRGDTSSGVFLAQQVTSIYRTPSLIDVEIAFDQLRWKALDDLAAGHYFDLEALIVYAYKLLILLRWEKIRLADKTDLLNKALDLN